MGGAHDGCGGQAHVPEPQVRVPPRQLQLERQPVLM
jgi:hypothetical protein